MCPTEEPYTKAHPGDVPVGNVGVDYIAEGFQCLLINAGIVWVADKV